MPLTYNRESGRYENLELDHRDPSALLARDIGLAMASARKMRGLTQSDVARMIGVRQTTVSNYERGDTAIEAARLASLAMSLQLDPAVFLGLDPGAGDVGLDERLRRAALAPVHEGVWWPSGHEAPHGAFLLYVYERSASLSLAVVKTQADRRGAIDPRTDRLRALVHGDAGVALAVLELELRGDPAYLRERGFDVTEQSLKGITLRRPETKKESQYEPS